MDHNDAELAARLDAATRTEGAQRLLCGPDGWLFLPAEDRLRKSRSIEAAWLEESARRSVDGTIAPGEAILDFDRQLAARGIALVFVPVPTKLSIYPERLAGLPLADRLGRQDPAVERLLSELEARGVRTLDLAEEFRTQRRPDPDPLYLATDSHWSPRGARLAALLLAERLRELGLASRRPATPCDATERTERREIRGDLAPLAAEVGRAVGPETILLHKVSLPPQTPGDPQADLLVLGDSHLAVWRARSSGFVDHLEVALCERVEQIAVQAGGATASRRRLAREPGLLEGKRAVVWVVSSRLLVSGPPWQSVTIPPLK